jgi:hypothetical protein
MVLGYGKLVGMPIDCASGRHENHSFYSGVPAFVEQIQREEQVVSGIVSDVQVGGGGNARPS